MEDIEIKMEDISTAKKNIISWYPFEKEKSLLEINSNSKQITEELQKKVKNVISINTEEIENVTETFDYITIIGLENINNNLQKLFEKIKTILKPNGKLLIAMNNKYSVKNLSTQNGINKILKNENKEYKLDDVIKNLNDSGFNNKKIYYPLTDYKFTNVIFTDEHKISKNELSRNIVYNSEESIKFFEENDMIDKLIEDNIELKQFLNSFFIEAFNGDYVDNEIKLVTFSNMRKNKYKIKTIVKKDYVYKYPDSDESKEHIENVKKNIDIMLKSKLKTIDSYDEEKIISKYVEYDTFDKVIIQTVKRDKNKALELIKKFKENLLENLEEGQKNKNVFDKYSIKYDTEIIDNMKFTKYGLWDLIFQNCFYIDENFYFYDQEWIEENVPIEFILYRAIKYIPNIKEYISTDELYGILDINEEKIKLFEELDNKIQEEKRNDKVWQMQKNGKSTEELRIQKLTDNHTINLLNIEIEKKKKDIEDKKKEIEELKRTCENAQNEVNIIYQSKSWKIAEKLINIRKIFK